MGADVLPVALRDGPAQRLGRRPAAGEDVAGEVDGPAGLDVVEDPGVEDVDARVDGVAEDLAPRRLLEEALDRAVLARDDDAELERVVDLDEPDRGHRAPVVVEGHDLGEIHVGDDVAGDDEEPLVEQLLGVADRAGGAEGRGLLGVGDLDAVARSRRRSSS